MAVRSNRKANRGRTVGNVSSTVFRWMDFSVNLHPVNKSTENKYLKLENLKFVRDNKALFLLIVTVPVTVMSRKNASCAVHGN